MVDLSDFLISYPCFIWGWPGTIPTVRIDDILCIAFFTDEDLFQQFLAHRKSHGDVEDDYPFRFATRQALLEELVPMEATAAKAGVLHIAIDPSQKKRVAVTTLRQFIEHIEASQS